MGKFAWRHLRTYEQAIAILAAVIMAAGIFAWIYGSQTVDSAVQIAEPVFLGLASLSIILTWAQNRETNVWNRLITYHEHFKDVPSLVHSEILSKVFTTDLGIEEPPTAYKPLTGQQVNKIWADRGAGKRPDASDLVRNYLNDFEQFCGAVSVGIVDEEYARELRGTRVIDGYFGYVEAIVKVRTLQEEQAKARSPSASAEPFTSKYYLELQKVATRWHGKRKAELQEQEKLISEANRKADEIRQALALGVRGKARALDDD